MFCSNCGKEIDVKEVVCPHCGVSTKLFESVYNYHYNRLSNPSYNNRTSNYSPQKEQTNVIAIVGLILALFFPVAGLVCSIIGLKKSGELGGSGRARAISGIIISAVSIVLITNYIAYYLFW